MNDLLNLLLASIAPTLMSIVALIAIIKNKNSLDELNTRINGRLSELIAAAKAQGKQEERLSQEEQDKKAARIAATLKSETADIASRLKSSTKPKTKL